MNAAPEINFDNLGDDAAATTATSDINVNTLDGDDVIYVSHTSAWQIDDINIDAGAPLGQPTRFIC